MDFSHSSVPPTSNGGELLVGEGCRSIDVFTKRVGDNGEEYSPIDDFINEVVYTLWEGPPTISLVDYEKIMQKHLKINLEQALLNCTPLFKYINVKSREELEQFIETVNSDTVISNNYSVKSFLITHRGVIIKILHTLLLNANTSENFVRFVNMWKEVTGMTTTKGEIINFLTTLVANGTMRLETVRNVLKFLLYQMDKIPADIPMS